MTRTPPKPRRGLTMIELLVVISLIIVLSSLALIISPRLAEDQRSVRAADQISGWLLVAKQRSYRDQQVRGVRLVTDADNPTWVKELVYIERPEDYRGGTLVAPAPPGLNPQAPLPFRQNNAVAFVHGKDLTNNGPGTVLQAGVPFNLPNEPIVQPLDFLVLDTQETIPYNSHRIYEVRCFPPSQNAPQGGTRLLLANAGGTQYATLNSGSKLGPLAFTEFHFVRQPRPMAGEAALQLPRDMIVDLDPSTPGPTVLTGFGQPDGYDIMFSPRGQGYGTNALGGKVILRLRNSTRPTNDGDQNYVVIYTRSGLITTHPVNFAPDLLGNIDYYLFLKDGNTSGF